MKKLILTVVLTTTCAACNKANFKSAKAGVIAKSSVFGGGGGSISGTGETYSPGVSQGGDKDAYGAIDQMGENQAIDVPVIQGGLTPLWRICSDGYAEAVAPAMVTTSIHLTITKSNGEIACQSSDTEVLRNMIASGGLDLPNLCPGITVLGIPLSNVTLKNAQGLSLLLNGWGSVIFADNPSVANNTTSLFPDNDPIYEKCDQKSSPLFVDLRAGHEPFELTSLADGILFDIQGENAKPVPHTKKHIGWFKNSAMAMLVLPNLREQVNGVNELFGNNTRGPDGEFAPHGFAALAKYDDNADGSIGRVDKVFERLSLWMDHDLNGIAGPGELISLTHLGIESIDLDFDPNFSEVDRYGNEVKYKSVVKFENGEMKLIYDLWFLTRN
ncbi:MAG: hypothetical protein AB7F86_11980 [Bdellovibrionales bacterium]